MKMNVVKKIESAKNNGLNEGEKVQAGVVLNDYGAVSGAAMQGGATQAAGIFGAMFAAKKNQKKAEESKTLGKSSTMADKFPKGMAVLGVTDTRVVAYSFDQIRGKAKELVAEYKKGDVKVADYEKGKLAHKVTLDFSDGGQKMFDLPRGNDIEALKAAL